MKYFPLISELFLIDSSYLKRAQIFPGRFAVIPLTLPWRKLEIVGFASLTGSEEVSEDGILWTYTLKVKLKEQLSGDLNKKAFMVKGVSGISWLIGTGSKPWVKISRSFSFGAPTEASSPEITATYKTTDALPTIRF